MRTTLRIRAGELRSQLEIQTQNTATTPPQWATTGWTSGSVEFLAGRQVFTPAGFNSSVSHLITVRFDPKRTIRSGMRLLCRGHTFLVQYTNDLEMRGATLNVYALEIDRNAC